MKATYRQKMLKKLSKLLLYCLCGVMVLSSCTGQSKKLVFISVKMLLDLDTTVIDGKSYVHKQEFYFVKNYRNNKISVNSIDSFVNKNKDAALTQYNGYSMIFYEQSDETNIKNVIANPRVLDRYSNKHDLIFVYSWYQGKFMNRYKDGVIIEPENKITVEDPPK